MGKIIVPTGYMGSGSSAITDLISEFKDVSNKYKSYEYMFLHCPNGLFDLEDKLLFGNNAIRSDEAIRSFEEMMKKLYDKKYWWVGNYKQIIGPNFMHIVNNFTKNIVEYTYKGFWYTHEEVNSAMFIKLLINKFIKTISLKKIKPKKVLKYKDGMKISFIKKDEFYAKAKEYIYEIIKLINPKDEDIILDQLLLPFNMHRVDNYFNDNLKVIVVERDPRDVFVLNKYIWDKKNIQVPFPTDAMEFAKFYRGMRESEINTDSNKVLRVKFEDLIYKYDEMLENIYNFIGVTKELHINKKSRFNPEVSIKNTQIFTSNTAWKEEVDIIESELQKYLYTFPYNQTNLIENTVEFE